MSYLRQQLVRNIGASWLNHAARVLIGFFFVPYITTVLGDARYGVWVIVFQTINYFSLLDIGLEQALVRFLSRHLSQGAFDAINRTLNTTFRLYLGLGSAIIVGVWLTATFLFGYLKIEDPLLAVEGRQALIIIGLYMGLRFYLTPFAGSLGGFQRFDITRAFSTGEEILRAAAMIWLLANGYGLVALAWTIVIGSLVRQALCIITLKRLYPQVSFAPSQYDRATAHELLAYSKVTLAITLGWLVLFNTDSILLGALVSSAAAGVYAPGAAMMLYVRQIINAVGTPLTAVMSHFEARNDLDSVRRLYVKGLKYSSYLSFLASVGLILYARPFVALWLAPEFAEAAEVMRILAVSGAFFVPQIIGNAVLFGTDNHRYLLRVLALEAISKVALSFLLIDSCGLIGMAYASAVPQCVLYVTMYPALLGKVLNLTPFWIVLTSLRSGLAAMLVSIPTIALMRWLLPPDSWSNFFVNVTAVCAVSIAAGWFILETDDRQRLKNKLLRHPS